VNICTLDEGWESDQQYVFIGRPSIWGNPARLSVFSREDCLTRFENYASASKTIMTRIHELSGKHLVCFCKPLPCHGDVLVRLFNKNIINF